MKQTPTASSRVGTAPLVRDALKGMSLGLLSLFNNDANDVGAPRILSDHGRDPQRCTLCLKGY